MGKYSFGIKNTIRGIKDSVENIENTNNDLDAKLKEISYELKKEKELYLQEIRRCVDYDPAKESEYEEKWNEVEKKILEEINNKINKAKITNTTINIISIILKLRSGIAIIGLFYAISH